MGRTVRDTKLETRAARAGLPQSSKPYFRSIDPGLQLGYRRGKRGGKWVVRWYAGEGRYVVDTIGTADDHAEADGVRTLAYRQAQAAARERATELSCGAAGMPRVQARYTVRDALTDYLEWMEQYRKSAIDARYRAEAHILPELGTLELAMLTTDRLRKWFYALAATPARLRTKKGQTQKFKLERGHRRGEARATGDRQPHTQRSQSGAQSCLERGQGGLRSGLAPPHAVSQRGCGAHPLSHGE